MERTTTQGYYISKLKPGTIGNTLEEPIGNLKGTCWEQRKNEKKILPCPQT
jgi:hypothetical protein